SASTRSSHCSDLIADRSARATPRRSEHDARGGCGCYGRWGAVSPQVRLFGTARQGKQVVDRVELGGGPPGTLAPPPATAARPGELELQRWAFPRPGKVADNLADDLPVVPAELHWPASGPAQVNPVHPRVTQTQYVEHVAKPVIGEWLFGVHPPDVLT